MNLPNETNIELPILESKRVLLRAPRERDQQDRLAFGRDPEFRRMVGASSLASPPLTMADVERWYARLCREAYNWVIENEGRCIGEARLHALDPENRRARYAIAIFAKDHWNRGLGTEATRLVLRYAFGTLHLHRVDLRVLAFNRRAICSYEKCGFVREGIEREGVWLDGEWHSDVIMSILEQEYTKQAEPAAQKE